MCDQASQVALVVENLPANAGDTRDVGLISGRGQSPGVGNGTPLQHSCLGNSMGGKAWQKELDMTEYSKQERISILHNLSQKIQVEGTPANLFHEADNTFMSKPRKDATKENSHTRHKNS